MERRQAEEIYRKHFLRKQNGFNGMDTTVDERESLSHMERLIFSYLSQCQPTERFVYKEFVVVLHESSLSKYFQADKAAKSFQMIEKYLSLLALSPWKQEFYRLKTFGGFYQSHVAYYLKSAERIFGLVGFTEFNGDLILRTPPAIEELIRVSFECQVASMECKMIVAIWNLLTEKLPLKDVVKFRLSHPGNAEDLAQKLKQVYQSSLLDRGVRRSRSGNVEEAYTRSTDSSSPQVAPPGENPTEPFRSKLKKHMRTLNENASSKMLTENIPFIDEEGIKEGPAFSQAEGTLDDHLQASLQIVNHDTTKARRSPEQTVGASEEWAYVRNKLQQDYGKGYYEGERKDILVDRDYENVETFPPPQYVGSTSSMNQPATRESRKVARPSHRLSAPAESFITNTSAADSAYFTQGSHIYGPPEIPENTRFSQGDRLSETDILRRKPALVPVKEESSRPYATTAPIRRGGPGHPNMAATVPSSKGRFSQSMPPVPYSSSNNVADGLRNIKASAKRTSVPTVTKETIIPKPMAFTAQSFSAPVHSKYDTRGEEAENGEKWSCLHCTFQNSPYALVCEVCSKSRDLMPETDAPVVGETTRVCDKCTFDNKIGSAACSLCGNVLGGTQTVV